MIFDSLFRAASYRNPPEWLIDALTGGRMTDAGIRVNSLSAFYYPPFWQGVNLIAGDIAQLPLEIYRRTEEGKEKDKDHPAHRLLKRRANDIMSSCTFKELLQSHALAFGNGRAGIVRDSMGRPVELVPFLPDRSWEEMTESGGLIHWTKLGQEKEPTPFRDMNVLHIKGLSFDGITGYNTIYMARDSLGLGLAAEKHGNRTFRNAARPSVILEADGRFTREEALQVLADWNEMLAGLDNQGKTALLSGGIKAKTLSQQNDHAQWHETRKYQRVEAAAWLGLQPHKLGDDSRTSRSSLEEENRDYVTSSLGRWFTKWEEECWAKLLSEQEKRTDSHYFKFNADAFLRGRISSRYAAYQIGIASEFLSPNEVREKEDMNRRPDPEGDEYRNPNTKSDKGAESEGVSEPEEADEERNGRSQNIVYLQGPAGAVGPQGPPGEKGEKGDKGDRGEAGAAGPQGEKGDVGETGPRGPQGEKGAAGVDGQDGRDGEQGPQGERGKPGVEGPRGPQGEKGEPGERGPQGETGESAMPSLVRNRIRNLIKEEIRVVNDMAGESRNFLPQMERFYRRFRLKLADAVAECGGDGEAVAEYLGDSHERLLQLSGHALPETLPRLVANETSDWLNERGEPLVRRILTVIGGQNGSTSAENQ